MSQQLCPTLPVQIQIPPRIWTIIYKYLILLRLRWYFESKKMDVKKTYRVLKQHKIWDLKLDSLSDSYEKVYKEKAKIEKRMYCLIRRFLTTTTTKLKKSEDIIVFDKLIVLRKIQFLPGKLFQNSSLSFLYITKELEPSF